MESQRADVRAVLIPGAMGFKGFIWDCEGIFAGLGAWFADGKSILAA
jgi:hypothetical protein